ncbi:hypothetical protein BT96DRAFT_993295 [Gymnopus androsaceus JB14]|uniref:F-box domain-containing protein n=1 Tax=Gymnopus androsaceus JB14 TaxID=1447944 RepID=A0A6A4HT38_9AGAR|nr:hypothetical protein BT96DRAFT_993295 [Gymnopus androsaceus JB14]
MRVFDVAHEVLRPQRRSVMFKQTLPPETTCDILDLSHPFDVKALASTSKSNRKFIQSYYSIRLSAHLSCYVNDSTLVRSTMDGSKSLIIGAFVLSFMNVVENINFPLWIAISGHSQEAWITCAAAEQWSLESDSVPTVFARHCDAYRSYRTSKQGRRVILVLSKNKAPIHLVGSFSTLAPNNFEVLMYERMVRGRVHIHDASSVWRAPLVGGTGKVNCVESSRSHTLRNERDLETPSRMRCVYIDCSMSLLPYTSRLLLFVGTRRFIGEDTCKLSINAPC